MGFLGSVSKILKREHTLANLGFEKLIILFERSPAMIEPSPEPLPGFSNAIYRDLLPRAWQSSPNLQKVQSSSLFDAIIATQRSMDEAPVLLSQSHFAAITNAVLADIGRLTNAYHNRLHTEQVMACCQILATAAQLSALDTQTLLLGGLFHDFDHPGTTLRQKVPSAIRNDLSNEEFAAIKADEVIDSALSPKQRLQLQGLILATSFGQKTAASLDELLGVRLQRDYAPYTPLEKLLAFADIGRFMLSPEAHVRGSLATLKESGAQPESYDEWLQGELGFLSYIETHMNGISQQIGTGPWAGLMAKLLGVRQYFEQVAEPGTGRTHLEQQYLEVLYGDRPQHCE